MAWRTVGFCVLFLVFEVLTVQAQVESRRRPPPDDQVRDQMMMEVVPPPTPRIVAHEWGVWLLEQGRITHLDDLAAESPPFVIRSPHAPRPRPNPPPQVQPPHVLPQPQPRPHPPLARKPVLYLTADRETPVTVEVGFAGGEPWLYYPDAQVTTRGTGRGPVRRHRPRSLVFSGRVLPVSRAILPAVAPGHWWNDVRAGGGHTFVSDAGNAESFLFYDGPVAFERSFDIQWRGNGAMVSPSSNERLIFLVTGGRFTESDVGFDTGHRLTSQGDMIMLRARLDSVLQQRGLTAPESRALLETWRDELFSSNQAQAIYMVPRDAYDRMLPMTITPAPAEMVRVGLVIQRL